MSEPQRDMSSGEPKSEAEIFGPARWRDAFENRHGLVVLVVFLLVVQILEQAPAIPFFLQRALSGHADGWVIYGLFRPILAVLIIGLLVTCVVAVVRPATRLLPLALGVLSARAVTVLGNMLAEAMEHARPQPDEVPHHWGLEDVVLPAVIILLAPAAALIVFQLWRLSRSRPENAPGAHLILEPPTPMTETAPLTYAAGGRRIGAARTSEDVRHDSLRSTAYVILLTLAALLGAGIYIHWRAPLLGEFDIGGSFWLLDWLILSAGPFFAVLWTALNLRKLQPTGLQICMGLIAGFASAPVAAGLFSIIVVGDTLVSRIRDGYSWVNWRNEGGNILLAATYLASIWALHRLRQSMLKAGEPAGNGADVAAATESHGGQPK